MNPIQLRDPNGNTAGYICGVCGQFPSASLLIPVWEPDVEPRRWSADWNEMALGFAERCCLCRRCGERETYRQHSFVCSGCREPAEAERCEGLLVWRKSRGYSAGRKAMSLMHALDRKAALQLLEFMSEWCEEKDCASWIDGLEHRMWRGGELTLDEYQEFRALVEKAGGIWTVKHEGDRMFDLFIPLAEWLELTKEREQAKVSP